MKRIITILTVVAGLMAASNSMAYRSGQHEPQGHARQVAVKRHATGDNKQLAVLKHSDATAQDVMVAKAAKTKATVAKTKATVAKTKVKANLAQRVHSFITNHPARSAIAAISGVAALAFLVSALSMSLGTSTMAMTSTTSGSIAYGLFAGILAIAGIYG